MALICPANVCDIPAFFSALGIDESKQHLGVTNTDIHRHAHAWSHTQAQAPLRQSGATYKTSLMVNPSIPKKNMNNPIYYEVFKIGDMNVTQADITYQCHPTP